MGGGGDGSGKSGGFGRAHLGARQSTFLVLTRSGATGDGSEQDFSGREGKYKVREVLFLPFFLQENRGKSSNWG